MVPMSLNGDGPSVREPEDMTEVSGQVEGETVDARVFVHAPQYHWHQEGGRDADARAAIERLHHDTFHFAQQAAQETQRLGQDIGGLSARVAEVTAVGHTAAARIEQLAAALDTTSAALEQQSAFLEDADEGVQQWQKQVEDNVAQTREQLVECVVKTDTLESTVKEMQRSQPLEWQKEVAALMDKQLQ